METAIEFIGKATSKTKAKTKAKKIAKKIATKILVIIAMAADQVVVDQPH